MKATSSKSQDIIESLQNVRDFVVYKRISKTIERLFLLLKINDIKAELYKKEKSKKEKGFKPEDQIKLCDTILKVFFDVE